MMPRCILGSVILNTAWKATVGLLSLPIFR